jgi:hypothetical protein
VQSYFEKLTSKSNEGKIGTGKKTWIRDRGNLPNTALYDNALFRPSAHFQNVLDEAYALALLARWNSSLFAHVAAELLVDEAAKAREDRQRKWRPGYNRHGNDNAVIVLADFRYSTDLMLASSFHSGFDVVSRLSEA